MKSTSRDIVKTIILITFVVCRRVVSFSSDDSFYRFSSFRDKCGAYRPPRISGGDNGSSGTSVMTYETIQYTDVSTNIEVIITLTGRSIKAGNAH